ncbi:MAG: carboxymuconolactone decarboxylase family protein [Acidimicrobiia bacterium]|nr:carboxymuconolactone decarboxylase family protein [Acidimicrobiia bacterium]MDH4305965.1 carboxymuconolactone decarboxylase family protein [Acidimicrobiia bacterium]MDH5292860.1 carboxymuconolactone decarboxylase family protein [Acidimicrobiia bacterium]
MSQPTDLSDEFAARRGRRYPAHAWIAERFPEYTETMLQLDEIIRRRPGRFFDEKGHELFHIVALAVMGSNPHNQPHLTQHIKKALQLGAHPEEIAEALLVAVNPAGARVITYGVTCMLEAISQLEAEGWNAPDQ